MITYELVREALSRHAHDGVSELSVKQLCAATGRSRRSVQMALREMRQRGLLSHGVHLGEGAFMRILEPRPDPADRTVEVADTQRTATTDPGPNVDCGEPCDL